MLWSEFPGGLLNQQNLAIDGIVHRISSQVSVLDADDRAENAQLHTLCAAHDASRGTFISQRKPCGKPCRCLKRVASLPESAKLGAAVNLIAMLFLRLIKMIIAPLVFATLVGGIAHMGSGSKLGRIFAKTMGWFVSASFVSLLLGLVMVNLLQPCSNFPGTLPDKAQSTGLPVSAFSIEKFLTHLIPTSIADAMAQN